MKGFHSEMKKENEERRLKRNTKILQKKERKGIFVFEKVFSKKKRRVNMRRVDEESDHQEGTYKERKHEESQNREKKNEQHKVENDEDKKERNLNRENFC